METCHVIQEILPLQMLTTTEFATLARNKADQNEKALI